MKTKIIRLICPKCLYDWIPRKENPRECPLCRKRLNSEKINKKYKDGNGEK